MSDVFEEIVSGFNDPLPEPGRAVVVNDIVAKPLTRIVALHGGWMITDATESAAKYTYGDDAYVIVHGHGAVGRYIEKSLPIEHRERRRDPFTRSPSQVRAAFDQDCTEWQSSTAHLGNAADIVLHPAYQRIIGLGPQALPLIIDDLRKQLNHWFWALTSITGIDAAEGAETMRAAAAAWIDWYDDQWSRSV